MTGAGDYHQRLLITQAAVIGCRVPADAGSTQSKVQPPFVEQCQQAGAGVFDDFYRQLRLPGPQARQGFHQHRHRAHDHPHRQATAVALHDAEHFFTQMGHVSVNQPRITNHAAPQVVGGQAFGRALEQG